MQQSQTHLSEIKLIGITARTSNKAESNWMEGKIFPCVQKYFHQQLAEKIPNRKKEKITYNAYFEVYDERSTDHQNIILDIYIGIHPNV